jgi:Ca-activated chloride channel family protein
MGGDGGSTYGGGGGYGRNGGDGDGIAVGERWAFGESETAGVKIEDGSAIASYGATDDDGRKRPVLVGTPEPVEVAKPHLALPSQPMREVSGVSGPADVKPQVEGTETHFARVDTKRETWSADSRVLAARSLSETAPKKSDDAFLTMGAQSTPEKPKTPVPGHVKVMGGRDLSEEVKDMLIDEGDETSSRRSGKDISESLPPTSKPEELLCPPIGTIDDFQTYVTGPDEDEENGRELILGDIPIVGGLSRTNGEKRPLSVEEKGQIVKHRKDKELQSQVEPVSVAPLNQSELSWKYNQELATEPNSIVLTWEDETDLAPASRFKLVPVNPWVMAERDPLSTFALDVDTASYTLCRRYIRSGFLPPAGAVRMEEFVNYFNYHYPQRTNPTFAVHAEAAPAPFARKDQNLTLLKIGVKARTIGRDQRKAAHLIFVVDASASMGQPDRLPLVQQALGLLVNRLSEVDRVTLITCASDARLHLETIPASKRDTILQAIDTIQPAGPTNLLAGLKLGYATARRSFAPKQINHVVLCSDGVANVGQTEAEAVLEEVAADRKQGITITCVGVGYGSYNDVFLEALANRGDGSYVFLDSAQQAQRVFQQAQRVFVEQLAATLQTVARDARIQVDFNPQRVRRYRLIGYENRDIEDKRFRDDTIDAGEVGSGQCSTALYELELIGQPSVDRQEDLGTVFVRYRHAETGQMEEISSRMSSAIVRRRTVAGAPRLFLAAGAARFAEMLRQSEHVQHGNLMDVFRVVEQVSLALPLDRDVRELAELIRKAEHLPRSP